MRWFVVRGPVENVVHEEIADDLGSACHVPAASRPCEPSAVSTHTIGFVRMLLFSETYSTTHTYVDTRTLCIVTWRRDHLGREDISSLSSLLWVLSLSESNEWVAE